MVCGFMNPQQPGRGWLVFRNYRRGGSPLKEALRLAQAQQAKTYELRAAVNLARLWGEQGRRAEARELLAPVYNWFTEGFDTADLEETKALLDELTWLGDWQPSKSAANVRSLLDPIIR